MSDEVKDFNPGQLRDAYGRWRDQAGGKVKFSDSFAGAYHRAASAAADATEHANSVPTHKIAINLHEKARDRALDAGYTRRAERHERAVTQHQHAIRDSKSGTHAIRIIDPTIVPRVTESIVNAVTGGTKPPLVTGGGGSALPRATKPKEAARAYWASRGVPLVGAERSRTVRPAHSGTYAITTMDHSKDRSK